MLVGLPDVAIRPSLWHSFICRGRSHHEMERPGLQAASAAGPRSRSLISRAWACKRTPLGMRRQVMIERCARPGRAGCGHRSARSRSHASASQGPPGSQPSAVAEEMFRPAASCSAVNVPSGRPSASTSYRPWRQVLHRQHVAVQLVGDRHVAELQGPEEAEVDRQAVVEPVELEPAARGDRRRGSSRGNPRRR